MKSTNLFGSVSRAAMVLSLATVGMTGATYAQDNNDSDDELDLEEIVVTGVRASERAAVDIKQNAKGVLDAIAAEDIGELPDASIAEALMTLPGVSGNQDRGRSNTLHVRGLSGNYTRTTLNGREIVSSFGSRSVNLSLYPSEVIRKGVVYKTGTPDQIEGGVAGTVDLSTIRPLNIKKNLRNINAFGLYNENAANSALSDGFGQNISGIFTQKFGDNFAIALGGAYLREEDQTERTNIGNVGWAGWQLDYDGDPDTREYSSGGGAFQTLHRDLKRDSFFGTAQWRPTEGLEVVLDALVSDFSYVQRMANIGFWGLNKNNDDYRAHLDQAIIGENGQVLRGYAPDVNINISPATVINVDKTEVYGANVSYEGDGWAANVDWSYSGSDRQYKWMGSNVGFGSVGLTWDFTDPNSISIILDEGVDLNQASESMYVTRVTDPDNITDSSLSAIKFDLEKEVSLGFINKITFGARFSENKKEFAGDGAVYDDGAVTNIHILNVAEPHTTGDAFRAFGGSLPADWFYFDPRTVLEMSGHQNDPRVIEDEDFFDFYDITEKTEAFYAKFDVDTNFMGLPLYGNFGVRYFKTEMTTNGVEGDYSLRFNSKNGRTFLDVDSDTLTPITDVHEYDYWLPTMNLNLQMTDKLYMRLGAGRTVLLPRMAEQSNVLNMNGGRIFDDALERQQTIGTRGNPYMDPIKSDQIDLSLEYYPRRGEVFSISLFKKKMDGVYEKAADYIEVADIPDVSLPVTTTVKAEREGTIRGVEFNFRKELDFLPGALRHLSLSGNVTFMDIDLLQDYNPNQAYKSWTFTETFYLPEGMFEKTGSMVLSYDDGENWAARMSWKHQDYWVAKDGQNYMLRRPSDIVSASVNYKINDNFKVVLQAWNLFNANLTSGHISSPNIDQPFPDYPNRYQASGRSFRFGVRASF